MTKKELNKFRRLIKFAAQHGFITEYFIDCADRTLPLWLAELQSWLRREHAIEVNCLPDYPSITNKIWGRGATSPIVEFGKFGGYICMVNDQRLDANFNEEDTYVCNHDTYEKAMIKGLTVGLILI